MGFSPTEIYKTRDVHKLKMAEKFKFKLISIPYWFLDYSINQSNFFHSPLFHLISSNINIDK